MFRLKFGTKATEVLAKDLGEDAGSTTSRIFRADKVESVEVCYRPTSTTSNRGAAGGGRITYRENAIEKRENMKVRASVKAMCERCRVIKPARSNDGHLHQSPDTSKGQARLERATLAKKTENRRRSPPSESEAARRLG